MPDTTPDTVQDDAGASIVSDPSTSNPNPVIWLAAQCLEDTEEASGLDNVLERAGGDPELTAALRKLNEAGAALKALGASRPLHERFAEAAENGIDTGHWLAAARLLSAAAAMGGEAGAELRTKVVQEAIQRMRQAYADKDTARVQEAAVAITAVDPGVAEAWYFRGRMQLLAGNAEEAVELLSTAVDLGPESQNSLLNLARAEAQVGNLRGSLVRFFQLLRLAEGNDQGYTPLAVDGLETLCFKLIDAGVDAQGQEDHAGLADAREMIEQIAKRVAGSLIEYVAGARAGVRVASGYARLAMAQGDVNRAIGACEAAAELNPDSGGLWATLGRLWLHANDPANAAKAFRRSLGIDNSQASVRDGLAEALLRAGDLDAAAAEAGQALSASPDTASIAERMTRIESLQQAAARIATEMPGRHVAVLGMPYMGGAGVAHRVAVAGGGVFVGETRWLAGQNSAGDEAPTFAICQTCRRPECSMFDMDFRASLTENGGDWYRNIVAASGAPMIVSSDNSPHVVRRLDPALECDAVIAYRSPLSAWATAKAVMERQGRPAPALLQYVFGWYRTYSAALHEFPQGGRLFGLDLDALASGDQDRIAEIAGSAPEGDAPEQHFFGVNVREIEEPLMDSAALVDALPADERAFIDGHVDAAGLYKKLQAL